MRRNTTGRPSIVLGLIVVIIIAVAILRMAGIL